MSMLRLSMARRCAPCWLLPGCPDHSRMRTLSKQMSAISVSRRLATCRDSSQIAWHFDNHGIDIHIAHFANGHLGYRYISSVALHRNFGSPEGWFHSNTQSWQRRFSDIEDEEYAPHCPLLHPSHRTKHLPQHSLLRDSSLRVFFCDVPSPQIVLHSRHISN